MRRRSFFLGAGAAVVGIAGCNRTAEQSSGRVTVPYLEVENYETSAATVTVLLTDTNQNVHLWKTVELDGSPARNGRRVHTHVFDDEWLEPRDYRLMVKWQEESSTRTTRVAGIMGVEDCAHLIVAIDGGIEYQTLLEQCPTPG